MYTILVLLLVKHFIIDFPLQNAYQYLNKGIYGHPGGLLHSALHILGSALVFMLCNIPDFRYLPILLFEFIIHYHTDWAKVQLTKKYNWSHMESDGLKITSSWYFHALGLDQLIHGLTYVGMLYLCMNL